MNAKRRGPALRNMVFVSVLALGFIPGPLSIAAAGTGEIVSVPLPIAKPAAILASLPDAPTGPVSTGTASALTQSLPSTVAPALNGPLDQADTTRYTRIFNAQDDGDFEKAREISTHVKDRVLMGHVLARQYLEGKAKASYADLKLWLAKYEDLPQAGRIYRLALARADNDEQKEALGMPPARRVVITGTGDPNFWATKPAVHKGPVRNALQQLAYSRVRADVNALRVNRPQEALERLAAERDANLDRIERVAMIADIAAGFLYNGDADNALVWADHAVRIGGTKVPQAGWVAGLAKWRKGEYEAAARYFKLPAESNFAGPWTRAAGAYWTARAYMQTGDYGDVAPWLEQAALYQRTFYGMIATRALGGGYNFNWSTPEYGAAQQKLIAEYDAGRRAMALAAVGRGEEAADELRTINPGNDMRLRDALAAFSEQAKLPDYALRFGGAFVNLSGGTYDAALYPLSPWASKHADATIDEALLNAFMRQESRFSPNAENKGSGATGLLQLRPSTARPLHAAAGQDERPLAEVLKNPADNVAMGQRYLASLLEHPAVNGDLFALASAYNAGPTALASWRAQLSDVTDPLLFIELIPYAETRLYVEKVMANYWIYRLRLDGRETPPSLDAVAQGANATYAMDMPLPGDGAVEMAQAAAQ